MATATKLQSTSLQLWPQGTSVQVRGEGPLMRIKLREEKRWRKPNAEERCLIGREQRAQMYSERDVLFCDSCLVDELLKRQWESSDDLAQEFSEENIVNRRQDPSDWDLEKCVDYLSDKRINCHLTHPADMDRQAVVELLESAGIECRDSESVEELREALVANIDDETIDGINDWRDCVRDNAEDEEIYEWWRVTDWLGGQLASIGECVLDNAYGKWWGRGCTGQSYMMDGVLQQVAAKFDH